MDSNGLEPPAVSFTDNSSDDGIKLKVLMVEGRKK
jgi:hypothetical protein